ncbi:MAG: terpene cyclase/mutase family protein [Pirellulales bacterium]|nr:terpene cyclase/mutase family protein [Pirellulales bacterium]
MSLRYVLPICCCAFLAVASTTLGQTATESSQTPPTDQKAYQQAVDRALAFLQTKGQQPDGSYAGYAGPGVTAVVTTAILRTGRTPDDPLVAKSLKYLEGFVQPDGGVYAPNSQVRNYETSLAILAFAEANRKGRYDKLLARADRFLKGLQWDEKEGHGKESYYYGGAGYGKHKRPDLSNTSFLLDALRAAGNGPDDEAVKRALVFTSRCQNLESTHNTTRFAAKNPDGGFYYTPAAGGTSQAGNTPDGGLRSYGSMTYAGLKSMIYAGVKKDDPRVKAALAWIQKHYDLTTNPGMGDAGLYYYYHTMAKALDAAGDDTLTDAKGAKHDWRADLRTELIRRQQPDGSWVNKNSRWLEGDPSLVTGYALLALTYCRPVATKTKP